MRQRTASLSLALLLIITCFVVSAFADGNETLGPPAALTLEQGSNVLAARTDVANNPGRVGLDVPAGALVTQALLYWRGTGGPTDGDIYVNGFPVTGTLVGQSLTAAGVKTSFRADITALGVLSSGSNLLVVSGDALYGANDAVSLVVLVDEGLAPAQVQLRDGSDYAAAGSPSPTDTVVPQDYPIVPDPEPRMAQVMVLGSDADTNCPRSVDVTVDGITTSFQIDPLGTGGQTGDPALLQVEVPAAASVLTVEPVASSNPQESLQAQAVVVQVGEPARIGDRVWNDLDADGIQDPGEPGLAGVTVRLYGVADDPSGVCPETLVATTMTDANGRYAFDVTRGSYFIEFVRLPVFSFSPRDHGSDNAIDSDPDMVTGRTDCAVVRAGEIDATWDAGMVRKSSIGDMVWEDLDQDGIQDGGEPGVPGVTVNLYNPASCGGPLGPVAATTTTDANGKYRFAVEGNMFYAIGFVAPAGFAFTLQDQGSDNTIDSDADPITGITMCRIIVYNEDDTDWDAGLVRLATIGDFVWKDLDADGIQDGGEPGIPGVTVNLRDCSGGLVATTTTNGSGLYLFTVKPGDYYVEFVAPAGLIFSPAGQGGDPALDSDADPLTGRASCTTLSPGENDLTWDAGLFAKSSIGDFVWDDLDCDGIQDTGEPGISGITVRLLDCSGNVLATTTTDSTGHYSFMVMSGSYIIEFVAPSGYIFSPRDVGANNTIDSDPDPLTGRTACDFIKPNETDVDWDAGMCRKASIGDFVWNDLNSNGIQDGGEPGVSGVTVTLKTCAGSVVSTTTTDSLGKYLFTVAPGDYFVVFTLPSGYTFTMKNQGGNPALDSDADTTTGVATCTTLSPGETDLTWDAGLVKPAPMGSWRTQTQGGWGQKASGNNPGSYRDAHFPSCYPSGVTIGKSTGKTAKFTTAKAVENYLPAGKTPGKLTTNYVNPTSTSAGVLGGQTLTLALNVGFDSCDPGFGSSPILLSTLVVADKSSACYGMTVQQVLDTANLILSGGSSSMTPSQINTCADKINNNFDDGTTNQGFLKIP